jgi:gamma-glutamylcyclotransferase (GGCT)/AIG2-like uncharacterized protein YtfP
MRMEAILLADRAGDSAVSEDPIRLFVYGTLRPGRPRFSAISRWVIGTEPATTQGILVSLGSFPALLPGQGIVQGDLLTVLPDAIEIADRIEGVSCSFYLRQEAETRLDVGVTVKAWVYFYGNPAAIADRPQLIVGVENGTSIYAWP